MHRGLILICKGFEIFTVQTLLLGSFCLNLRGGNRSTARNVMRPFVLCDKVTFPSYTFLPQLFYLLFGVAHLCTSQRL